MGYLTIARISGDPDDLYARHQESAPVMDEVGRDHGLILHAAAKAEDGLVIVNLWPSKDRSESAAQDPRRLNALKQHGIEPGQVSREHHEDVRYVAFEGG